MSSTDRAMGEARPSRGLVKSCSDGAAETSIISEPIAASAVEASSSARELSLGRRPGSGAPSPAASPGARTPPPSSSPSSMAKGSGSWPTLLYTPPSRGASGVVPAAVAVALALAALGVLGALCGSTTEEAEAAAGAAADRDGVPADDSGTDAKMGAADANGPPKGKLACGKRAPSVGLPTGLWRMPGKMPPSRGLPDARDCGREPARESCRECEARTPPREPPKSDPAAWPSGGERPCRSDGERPRMAVWPEAMAAEREEHCIGCGGLGHGAKGGELPLDATGRGMGGDAATAGNGDAPTAASPAGAAGKAVPAVDPRPAAAPGPTLGSAPVDAGCDANGSRTPIAAARTSAAKSAASESVRGLNGWLAASDMARGRVGVMATGGEEEGCGAWPSGMCDCERARVPPDWPAAPGGELPRGTATDEAEGGGVDCCGDGVGEGAR